MESNLESRLKNLNRIESLLTELRSSAPAFAIWRPLLQAVIELSGEFKEHVQELRDKELKAAAHGHGQQNGTVEKVNGSMPTLEAEVSVFDNARSLRLNSHRNRIRGNQVTIVNGNNEPPIVNGNDEQPVVNGNSEQPVFNGHAKPSDVTGRKVINRVSKDFNGEIKTQDSVPKAKLQITSNIKQLYSIRRRPKMPPSEVVRATATRTKSRSPSPQQLLSAGPWPNTIITKAFIEPTPRSEREKRSDVQVTHAQDTTVANSFGNQNSSESKATRKSDDDISTQENNTLNVNDTATAKTINKQELKKTEKSVVVSDKCNSKVSTSEAPKCQAQGSAKLKSKSKNGEDEVKKIKIVENKKDKSKDSDHVVTKDAESKTNNSTKLHIEKTSSDDKIQDKSSKVQKEESTNKSTDSNEDGNKAQREDNHSKNTEVKHPIFTKRVTVLLEDIKKGKNRGEGSGPDVGGDQHPAGLQVDNVVQTKAASKPEETDKDQGTTADKIKVMEAILADMLKRHKSEDEEANEPEKSVRSPAESTKTEESSKEKVEEKPKPPAKCRTKAMLLQKLRQSTSLENLSSCTKEVDTTGTKSKTDDNLSTGSQSPRTLSGNTEHSNWTPAVNVRAFTQPVKDPAHKAQKSVNPAVCWSPITRPAPVVKVRARKQNASAKVDDPDWPPAKVPKRPKNSQRQSDESDESGTGDRVSVTKSKAYQDFVHGLYENKVDKKKASCKANDLLLSEESVGSPNVDLDSAHSCTSATISSGSSSRDSDSRSTSSDNIRRSTRTRVPKYYGPDMFLIDDSVLVNYKALKPHLEGNIDSSPQRKKSKRSPNYGLEFLQYEGENSDDTNVKPKKSRNSKYAFTIKSARKNTSAYQMKNVEVRLQKMSIDEDGNVQTKGKDSLVNHKTKSPRMALFGKNIEMDRKKDEMANNSEGELSTGSEASPPTKDKKNKKAVPNPSTEKAEEIVDLDAFPTPGSSFHRSTAEPDLSESALLLEDADERENEKENDVDAAKQLLEDEKAKEKNRDSKTDSKKESWRGRPAELQICSTLDVSIDLTSDDEVTDKTVHRVKTNSIFSASESEGEFATSSRPDVVELHNTQHRRKHKNPKKVYRGNRVEQLGVKYGVIKYGVSLSSKKREQSANWDSDSTAAGSVHDSSASTVVFPGDKDSSIDKNILDERPPDLDKRPAEQNVPDETLSDLDDDTLPDLVEKSPDLDQNVLDLDEKPDNNNDETMTTASHGAKVVSGKEASKQAISAWNDSVYQTFDKAIDLCLRSNNEAVGMTADRDTDQESLHLQLDLDDQSDESRTPVAKEIKSQSDTNVGRTSGDGSSFHFLNKDGSVVGRMRRETCMHKRSASSDRILDKDKSSPHVMVNDFSVVIKVMNMLQDFMKDEKERSLNVTSLPVKQHKMLEEICKICHLDVVTDTSKNKLVIKNRASSTPSMKDLAKITSW